jgi:hypothetical protein
MVITPAEIEHSVRSFTPAHRVCSKKTSKHLQSVFFSHELQHNNHKSIGFFSIKELLYAHNTAKSKELFLS